MIMRVTMEDLSSTAEETAKQLFPNDPANKATWLSGFKMAEAMIKHHLTMTFYSEEYFDTDELVATMSRSRADLTAMHANGRLNQFFGIIRNDLGKPE